MIGAAWFVGGALVGLAADWWPSDREALRRLVRLAWFLLYTLTATVAFLVAREFGPRSDPFLLGFIGAQVVRIARRSIRRRTSAIRHDGR